MIGRNVERLSALGQVQSLTHQAASGGGSPRPPESSRTSTEGFRKFKDVANETGCMLGIEKNRTVISFGHEHVPSYRRLCSSILVQLNDWALNSANSSDDNEDFTFSGRLPAVTARMGTCRGTGWRRTRI